MLHNGVHFILWSLSKVMAVLYTPVHLYYIFQTPKRCPSVRPEIFFMPATILAEKIRQRKVSSTTLVSAYIDRVKQVNPILNAVVESRYHVALHEAEQVDDFLETTSLTVAEIEQKHPLLGVPMTVKESIAVAGMSHDAGRKHSYRYKAKRDADIVGHFKSAGAVIILVSNTPELCMNWETSNYVTGRTLNPYDTRRTCGGSSGGEAALLATSASVIGVGSDVVGSLRLPSAYCGIYGHRPTSGLVSVRGHYPCNSDPKDDEIWELLFTFGPMSRYSVDLPLLLHVMMKPEMKPMTGVLEEIDARILKVYYMKSDGSSYMTNSINKEITDRMDKVVQHLDEQGLYTKSASVEKLSDSIDLGFLPMLDMKSLITVFDYDRKSILAEILRHFTCNPTITPTGIFLAMLRSAFERFGTEECVNRNKKLLQELKDDLLELLGDDGVLLYPVFPDVAHFHGAVYSKTLDTSYMGIFSSLGFPVTVCPIGLNSKGMPIGLQVISKPNNDRLCLALVRHLELTFGGWTPPPYLREHMV